MKERMLTEQSKAPPMQPHRDEDQFMAALRAKLHSSQIDSGRSLSELAPDLPIDSASLLRDYFSGKKDMPVSLLYAYARLVGRPLWWFFGEQPATISVESAETALANVARARLYLEAIESEFHQVLAPVSGSKSLGHASQPERGTSRAGGPVVVDFAPYLSRARAILERETEFHEESEEVFEESVEMIAHSLYSIEMAKVPSREGFTSSESAL